MIKIIINMTTPSMLEPNMLPIWLNTDEMTEVARPSARSLEYERISLKYPVTL